MVWVLAIPMALISSAVFPANFFQGINTFYNGDPASNGGYVFEPHVAESVFNSMLAQYSNITVHLGTSFGSVTMNGTTITGLVGSDGVTYQGRSISTPVIPAT